MARKHRSTSPEDRGLAAPGNGTTNGRTKQYRRAKLRHLIFTSGPNRLSGGLLRRAHLAQEVVVRNVDLSIAGWPKAFDGMRIGHISDLHVGDLLPVEKALAVVDLLREQEPDLVACTGDVVDLDNHLAPPILEAMAKIDAAFGAMLVLGNHDHLDDADRLADMAQGSGMTVLRDDAVELVHNGDRLVVGGTDWGRTVQECSRRVQQAADQRTHLLLAHNPKAFIEAARLGISLTLAGHTHGGQVARRRNPNHNLAMAHRCNRGLYEHDRSRLYVTTGVGAWFPLRVNCPPEIAMITVRSA
ncbi:MAG: metallophosphoesterase family protein [Phycisphaerales bacterium]|nr:metallophosphoesterase family protein [Phycisphaerales bacterium]